MALIFAFIDQYGVCHGATHEFPATFELPFTPMSGPFVDQTLTVLARSIDDSPGRESIVTDTGKSIFPTVEVEELLVLSPPLGQVYDPRT